MKKIRRAVFIVVASLVVLLAGADVAVHTPPVNRLIRARIIRAATAGTGARIEIRRMAIHWTNLGADLYGLAVYGRGGTAQPPLFESPHLKIDLSIGSLLQGKLGITKLVLDHPVVHFSVNDQGETNLPEIPSAGKPSLPGNPLFALAIRQVAIRDGQIHYNSATVPLSAELAGFGLRIDFDALKNDYKGSVGYDRGLLSLRRSNPVENSLEVHFVVGRTKLTVDPLRARLQNSRLLVKAELTGFAHPDIRASYALTLDTPEIARILKIPSLPSGEIVTSGTAGYRNDAGPSLLDRVQAEGRFSSSRLAVRAGQVRAVARSARGEYALEQGNLAITDLQAGVLGGQLRVKSGTVSLTGQSASRMNVSWQRVSLKDLSAMLLAGRDRSLHVTGRTSGEAGLSWKNDIRRMALHSRAKMSGGIRAGTPGSRMPLNAVLDMRYDGARDSGSFHRSYVRIGGTKLALDGTFGNRSNLGVKLEASDLHDFSDLIVRAGKAVPSARLAGIAALDLQGSARFSGRVSGSLQNPRVQGRLAAQNLQVEAVRWPSVATNLDLSPSEVALKNAVIRASGGGRLDLNAKAGLRRWAFDAARPVSIQASARNVRLASIEKLARVSYPVSGVLSADLSVQGTGRHPSGNGSVRIVRASAWNQPVRLVAIDFRGNEAAVHSTADLRTDAGDLHANLTWVPQTMDYELAAHSSGIRLDRIEPLKASHSGLEGTLVLSASGRGKLANPELSAILKISNLRAGGQSFPGAQGDLNIANHRATFTARAGLYGATAQAKGSVTLGGEYDARAVVDVSGLSLATALARYGKNGLSGLEGKADLHADFNGPLKAPARIEGRVEVPTLHLAYAGTQAALVAPLRLDYRAGVATIQKAQLRGPQMDFTLQGTIPVEKTAPMNIDAGGTVDLGLLRAMTSGIYSSGRLAIHLAVHGPFSRPAAEGTIRVENAALSSVSIPVNLSGVNGQIRLAGDRLEIQNLTGRLSGGTMSAQGFLIYGAHPVFNLALRAKSVGLRYPQGVVTVLDGNLRFAGTEASSALTGRVIIDQMALTRQFELASLAGGMSPGAVSGNPSPLERHASLNVTIESAQTLHLVSSQLSLQGGADLTLAGTLAHPVVLGRATVDEGEIFFLNRRYEIQNGTIEFSNPVRNDPVLNVYASTTIQQYKITMNLAGPLDRLRTSYTSDPPLAPSDIINLIAFGKTSEQAANGSGAPSVLGAEAVLAQGIAGQLTGKIQKLAGISQLTINPLIGNGTQGLGADISIQQRVTGRLLLTFTTNTTQTQAAAVQVQYDATRHISVTGLRDRNGGYAVDVHFHKSF